MAKPDRPAFQIETAASFIRRELPASRPIVGGGLLDRRSVQVIGGMSKIGKSMLAINEGLCIAAGKPWLLQFEVPEPTPVLYLQAEIASRPLQTRLKTMIEAEQILQDAQDRFMFVPQCKGIKLTQGHHLQNIGRSIHDSGARVVIIDPLSRFFTGDENKASDVQKLVDAVDNLVAKHGVSIILVHHHGKPPADGSKARRGAQQLRGSSVLFDAFDSYINLNRKKGQAYGGYARMTFDLRNDADPNPLTIHRDPTTLWWQVIDEDTRGKASGTVADAVKALESLNGAALRADLLAAIQQQTGLKKRAAADLLTKATTLKQISIEQLPGRGAPKRFWLPEKWAQRELL